MMSTKSDRGTNEQATRPEPARDLGYFVGHRAGVIVHRTGDKDVNRPTGNVQYAVWQDYADDLEVENAKLRGENDELHKLVAHYRELYNVASDFAPALGRCTDCGSVVARGYCCRECGSTDPSRAAEVRQ
jgi:hypothetical protein